MGVRVDCCAHYHSMDSINYEGFNDSLSSLNTGIMYGEQEEDES
jgi:hypothetical protein